ncbi:hypothetical protein CEXT_512751 [Caerostris extrusa]|uniref:Uncharacterized protein n=1 Tax=Caerostris extrusa TaxID=172846 RepID=A0AAV4MP18_CAEEX|nr:hypothetical protein CEXT_512751 [Caerostris extrusa]
MMNNSINSDSNTISGVILNRLFRDWSLKDLTRYDAVCASSQLPTCHFAVSESFAWVTNAGPTPEPSPPAPSGNWNRNRAAVVSEGRPVSIFHALMTAV